MIEDTKVIELTNIIQELAQKLSDLEKESFYLKTKGIIPDWKDELKLLKDKE